MCRKVNTSDCVSCLCKKTFAMVLPFRLGENCTMGMKRVSDNTCYICTKDHIASPEIFIGAPGYWEAFYDEFPISEPVKADKTKPKEVESIGAK